MEDSSASHTLDPDECYAHNSPSPSLRLGHNTSCAMQSHRCMAAFKVNLFAGYKRDSK